MFHIFLQRFVAVTAVLACGLAFGVSDANAQTTRLYLSGYLGLSDFGSNEFDDGSVPISGELDVDETYAFAGALGLRLSQNLRVEAELSYKNNDFKNVSVAGVGQFGASGEIETYSTFLSAYYDFNTQAKLQPFLGAGIGLGFHDANITNTSGLAANTIGNDYNFMYHIGGGLKYRLKPNLAFTGGYRYIDGTDLEIGTYNLEYGGHELRFGIEYDLPFK